METSRIGFGCYPLTGAYGAVTRREARATLERAVELGVTMFDTADSYGPHTNEELVGWALRARRDEVVIATKVGIRVSPQGTRFVDGSPGYVRDACHASLARLRVDQIDLLYIHRIDGRVPIEETVGALAALVGDGKVRHIGLSEAAPATIRRAHAIHPLTAVQTEYSLWERGPEGDVLGTLRELGIGLTAFSPLGRGFLLGSATAGAEALPGRDVRRTLPRFQAENAARNARLVGDIARLARVQGLSASQLALAWLLAQGPDVVPIPGTRSRGHLEENVAALDQVLRPEVLSELNGLLERHPVAGARYPPEAMARVDRAVEG